MSLYSISIVSSYNLYYLKMKYNWSLFTFIVYFCGELLMMMTISSLAERNYKLSSIFQFLSLFIFTSLFIYNYFQHGQSYYVLASVTFTVSALKNLLKYNFQLDSKYINWLFTFIVWVIFMLIWHFYKFFVNIFPKLSVFSYFFFNYESIIYIYRCS